MRVSIPKRPIYLSDGLEGKWGRKTSDDYISGKLNRLCPAKTELPIVLFPRKVRVPLRIKLRRLATDMPLPVPVTAYAENGRALAELQVNFSSGRQKRQPHWIAVGASQWIGAD